MSVQTTTYGTRTIPTFTLASLTNGSSRQSDAIDNSSAGAVDALVTGKITTGTTPTVNTTFTVFVYGGDSVIYAGSITGSDGAYTPAGQDKQLAVAAVVVVTASSNVTYTFAFNVAALFGGNMPKKWGFVVTNNTAVTFNATGGNFEVAYQNITYTIT